MYICLTTHSYEVDSGDSVFICELIIPRALKEMPTFERISNDFFEEYSLQILSADNELLIEWKSTEDDNPELPDYLNENNWRKFSKENKDKTVTISWTYDFYE